MSKKTKEKRSRTKQPPLVVIDHDDYSDGIMVYADPEVAVVDRSIERWGEHFCFEEYRDTIPDKWREIIGEFDDWDPKARARDNAEHKRKMQASHQEFIKNELPRLRKMWNEQGPETARSEAEGLPCVVIDRDAKGNDCVYADPGVVVFSRSSHTPDDALYRYAPSAIPGGWLDRPAEFQGDGSAAEGRALTVVEAIKEFEGQSDRDE